MKLVVENEGVALTLSNIVHIDVEIHNVHSMSSDIVNPMLKYTMLFNVDLTLFYVAMS